MSKLDEESMQVYMGTNYLSIIVKNIKRFADVRRRFHDFDLTMNDAGSVAFIGEHYDFPGDKDIITIFYATYFTLPGSKTSGNIDVSYRLHEKDLPAEFMKKGCGFKDVETVVEAVEAEPESITTQRAFVCD